MTILSKKKTIQGKSEESSEATPHHNVPHSLTHGIPLSSLPNHSQISDRNRDDRRNSPHSWPREEKRPSHVPDYDSLESGPSHSKRRHRASTRSNKLRERERVSPGSSPKAGPSSDDKLELTGYNSGDEHGSCDRAEITEAEWQEKDRLFEKKMRKRGLTVKPMGEDGACLFRAVADQVYGDQEMHDVVRKHCMDYIAANGDYFSQYVTEDFTKYVDRKRQLYTHGNHIEMQAMSEMYNRPVEVFCYGKDAINIFHGGNKTENEPIRLSYQRGSHYNSIIDPHKATIGVGLGLPNFSPGGAEKSLIKDAVRQSEDSHIEQTMLEDKLRATDWEATNETIEEQVARDSYLQWLRDNEKRDKALAKSATVTSTSATVTSPEVRTSPRSRLSSPKQNEEPSFGGECSQSFNLVESASFLNILSPSTFGLSEWEDASIFAQVLAQSQQEYLDNLKKATRGADSGNQHHNDSEFGGPSTSS